MAKSVWRFVLPSNANGSVGPVPLSVLEAALSSGYYCELYNVETGERIPLRKDTVLERPIPVDNVQTDDGQKCIVVLSDRHKLSVRPAVDDNGE